MKKLLLLLVAIPLCALGQGSSTGLSYLKLPAFGRLAALAESPIADREALGSVALNPAAIYRTSSSEALLSETKWVQDIETQALSVCTPSSIGTFAFSVGNTSVPGIEIRDIPGPSLGSFTSRATVFEGSFATELFPDVVAGIGAKYLYEKIYVDERTGYSFDAGAVYTTPVEGLSVGAALTNVGSVSAFRTDAGDLPTQLAVGAAYAFRTLHTEDRLFASFSDQTTQSRRHVRFGAEIAYDSLLALRLGYQSGYDARGLSLGLGISYSVIRVDYAFLPFSFGFGSANLVSVGIRF